mgnify:CR=1 FL=1|jgi:hypothetical protein
MFIREAQQSYLDVSPYRECKTIANSTDVKVCVQCGKVQPLKDYHYEERKGRKSSYSYYRNRCRKCIHVIRRERYTASPQSFLRRSWVQLRSARKRQGHTVFMSFEDILTIFRKQKGKCALTGLLMTNNLVDGNTSWSDNQTNISIDRKDNSKGYEKNNIQLVCKRVNIAKHTLNNKEFITWCQRVTTNQSRAS